MKVFKKNNLKYVYNFLLLVFVLLSSPLFFYKLGQTSLISWDEAWYAEVARNIMQSGNLINMTWNGNPYFDHPPTGYWLMALTYKVFGVNEFWTRFPSALSGIISIVLLYLLGKKLFNPLVGLSSAVALSSAIWFIFRSRSGNLDIILTMFFILTILLAVFAAEKKKFLSPFAISLSLLFLTKSMIPLAIIPTLVVIFFKNEAPRTADKLYRWQDLMLPTVLFLAVTGGWFISQIVQYSNFLQNYLGVGLRGTNLNSTYLANLSLAKDYLYNGIGRWFWPAVSSLVFSIFLKQKRFFILVVFFITFILPITFSPKIQIWHLIPLIPILILIYFGFIFAFLEKYVPKWKYLLFGAAIILSSLIYISQVKTIWYQFIDIPAYVSDEAILSKEAKNYPQRLIVDGEYRPAALFYSEKGSITQAPKKEENFILMFKTENNFLMITNKWQLDKTQIPLNEYQILKEDRDKVLILHK